MLSRQVRRAALDTRWTLPPTFLCPWTATLTTEASSSTPSMPPSMQSSTKPKAASSPAPRLPSPSTSQNEPSSSTPPKISDSVATLLPLLRAQNQIYMTAHIHARAYMVTQGDTVRLPFHMPNVQPGDVLRLNRAVNIGSRDFTLRAPAKEKRKRSPTATTELVLDPTPESTLSSESMVMPGAKPSASLGETGAQAPPVDHFVPYMMKGRIPYIDERMFVCRATVMGTESEPLRVMEKTKQRQRHIKYVKSKHKYTILRIKELRVRSLEEIERGEVD